MVLGIEVAYTVLGLSVEADFFKKEGVKFLAPKFFDLFFSGQHSVTPALVPGVFNH